MVDPPAAGICAAPRAARAQHRAARCSHCGHQAGSRRKPRSRRRGGSATRRHWENAEHASVIFSACHKNKQKHYLKIFVEKKKQDGG